MESTPDKDRLTQLFFPYAHDSQRAVQNNGTRLVHYTSAEAAINILKSKEVWMRKSSCMDDFMEVRHGLQCLAAAYHGEIGQRLKKILDDMFSGISGDITKRFDSVQDRFEYDTYLLCVSEHDDLEDEFGRLSMWRAYGDTTGVALVMNNAPFFNEADLKAFTSPVAYLDDARFEEEFSRLVDGIEADSNFVHALGRECVTRYVFTAFMLAALCTKHPGFKEEREWRVIYPPALGKSDYLVKDIRVIRGAPQPIYKIPLRDIPQANFFGAEIPALLDRIIIGPTEYGAAMLEAFEDLLACRGVDNPANRISVSDIPLR